MSASPDITDCYPIELHFIKALFLDGQYRRCIQACRDLIHMADDSLDEDMLRTTFINFYLGLAHDEMARKMHPSSVARMPSLDSAERAFHQALDSLPSPQQARKWCHSDARRFSSSSPEEQAGSGCSLPHSPTLTERALTLSSLNGTPIPFSPPQSSRGSLITTVPLRGSVSYPDEDAESEDSFSQLLTPNRLKRDISRMSLLDTTSRLPREVSKMSLLDSSAPKKPKPGSLPQIQIGDSLAEQRSESQARQPPCTNVSVVPPRSLQSSQESSSELNFGVDSETHFTESQPVSPLSSYDYFNQHWSNMSPVSALPPETPKWHESSCDTSLSSDHNSAEERVLRFLEMLDTLRDNLKIQLTFAHELKKQTKTRKTRLPPSTDTPLGRVVATSKFSNSPTSTPSDKPMPAKGGIQQARSYWSFVPENVKETERQNRIEHGRERGWERKRFDPTRYQEICERALADLSNYRC